MPLWQNLGRNPIPIPTSSTQRTVLRNRYGENLLTRKWHRITAFGPYLPFMSIQERKGNRDAALVPQVQKGNAR